MADETSSTANDLPSSIGRYQITGALGFGAMGAVYKAFDPLIKRTLAIKTIRLDIPRQSPQYAGFLERFYREARISGTLSHPNVVTLFDIGEEGGLPFLAMEFVDGCTLASVLEQGTRFKPEKVIGLVSQVAAALDYAHSRGVVHRDIKPSNLILFDEEKVKVTDFGIAKAADSDITHAGVLLGTPSYMSPEQAMGESLDGRSDIFSLGVCAFEMLSGQQPFPGSNVTAILYKLVHVDPVEPPDLEMSGLLPQKWHDVFRKVLAKKPADRYETASAFVQDLEFCLGDWFTGIGATTIRMSAAELATAGAAAGASPRPLSQPSQPPEGDAATLTLRIDVPPAGGAQAAASLPAPDARDGVDSSTLVFRPSPLAGSSVPAPPPSPPRPRSATNPGAAKAGAPPRPAAAEDDAGTLVLRTQAAAAEADDSSTLMLAAAVPADESATVVLAAEPRAEGTVPFVRSPAVAGTAGAPETVRQQRLVGAAAPLPIRRAARWPFFVLGAAAVIVVAALAGWAYQRWRTPASAPVASPVAAAPAAPAAVPPTPAEPVAPASGVSTGALHVQSSPAGARVLLDGEPRGETPLDIGELPFGAHEVRIEQKGFTPQTQTVSLGPEQPEARIEASLVRTAAVMASAEILSEPSGALVTVDGRRAGQTPLRALTMRPGSHRLEMALAGFASWSGALDVVAGQKGRVEVRLQPLPRAAATPAPESVDTARVYRLDELDTPPRKSSGSSPSYPSERGAPRLKSGERVSVVVQFVVSETGEIHDLKVAESGGPILDQVVLEAIRSWRFQPATKRGTRVKAQTVFKQTFLGG